jgi:hypothetical protein
MAWTTPKDVRAQIQRLWERGRILGARLAGEPLFPYSVRLSRPDARELSDRFADARAWIRALEEDSKNASGAGYDVIYAEINHRELGANRVPDAIVVASEDDALSLIGKRRSAETFDRLVQVTREACPELIPWIARRPLALLEHADDWPTILALLGWFRSHPRPGLYVRQIDVPGVHTKFIEERRKLLAELLDLVLPFETISGDAVGVTGFERRYGLRSKPALIRFRILDPRWRIGGLSDIATPAEQFAELDLPIRHVFITENEINGLAFPEAAASIVVFGLGYGLERLACVPWLRDKAVCYWGDLDTHGFAILDRLRAIVPAAQSFLMDRDTLMGHQEMWGREPLRHDKPLARLTPEECRLYDDLRLDRLGQCVRLEQERVRFSSVERALAALLKGI